MTRERIVCIISNCASQYHIGASTLYRAIRLLDKIEQDVEDHHLAYGLCCLMLSDVYESDAPLPLHCYALMAVDYGHCWSMEEMRRILFHTLDLLDWRLDIDGNPFMFSDTSNSSVMIRSVRDWALGRSDELVVC